MEPRLAAELQVSDLINSESMSRSATGMPRITPGGAIESFKVMHIMAPG